MPILTLETKMSPGPAIVQDLLVKAIGSFYKYDEEKWRDFSKQAAHFSHVFYSCRSLPNAQLFKQVLEKALDVSLQGNEEKSNELLEMVKLFPDKLGSEVVLTVAAGALKSSRNELQRLRWALSISRFGFRSVEDVIVKYACNVIQLALEFVPRPQEAVPGPGEGEERVFREQTPSNAWEWVRRVLGTCDESPLRC